jgi:hypothetical protein
MRRLVVASVFLILVGLVLLLPSSALASLLTNGSTSTGVTSGFSARGATATTSDTTTIESLVGFGLLGVGLVLEFLSLFTDVGGAGVGGIGAAQTKPAVGEKQQQ